MAIMLTVVVPCYNQAQYLSECLDSILNQTAFSACKIIVVNDGSTDNVESVFEEWCDINREKVKNIITMISKPNGGLAEARNSGIREAETEWILPLDADDIIDSKYFEKVIRIVKSKPDISIVSTWTKFFGENEVNFWTAKYLQLDKIKYQNNVPCCTLFKKSLWKQAGGYKANMIYGYEDWEFWINCAKLGAKSYIIPEKLFCYRIKPGSMISNARKWDAYLRSLLVINHRDVYNAHEQEIAELFIKLHDAVVIEKNRERYAAIRQKTRGLDVPKFFGEGAAWKKYLIFLDEKIKECNN